MLDLWQTIAMVTMLNIPAIIIGVIMVSGNYERRMFRALGVVLIVTHALYLLRLWLP